jgi:4-hydroxy-4-methyl-2-oxoglutarate aldolase
MTLRDDPIARRALGDTGVEASVLGFGTGDNAGLMVVASHAEQRRAVDEAVAAGINYFDTSPDYGRGRAEENLGRALKGRRTNVLISTKVDIMPADRRRMAKKVVESLDESLRRLQTDYVDVLMIHNQPSRHHQWERTTWAPLVKEDFLCEGGALDGLARVVASGKVRFGGIACEGATPDVVAELVAHPLVQVLNVWLNMLNPSSLLDPAAAPIDGPVDYRGIAAACARNRVGIAGFRALGGGALMSAVSNTLERHPVAGGVYSRDSSAYRREVELASRLVARLGIASTEAMAAVAYRFNISDPRVSTTVGGFSDVAHLRGAIAAVAGGPMPAAEWDEVLAAWRELFVRYNGVDIDTKERSGDDMGSGPVTDYAKEFAVLPASAVAEALDRLGINGRCNGVNLVSRGGKACGRAFTVQFLPCGPPDGRTPNGDIGSYIDDVPAGYIIALDNRGSLEASVWDEILTHRARELGIAGTVIDGACDQSLRSQPYALFACGTQSLNAKNRMRVEACNLPIVIGGVRVECDDILLGDGQGTVVVPRDHLASVLAAAREIATARELSSR